VATCTSGPYCARDLLVGQCGQAPAQTPNLRKFLDLLNVRLVNALAFGAMLVTLLVLYVLGHFHSDWLTMTDLTSRLATLPQALTPVAYSAKSNEVTQLQEEFHQLKEDSPATDQPGRRVGSEQGRRTAMASF